MCFYCNISALPPSLFLSGVLTQLLKHISLNALLPGWKNVCSVNHFQLSLRNKKTRSRTESEKKAYVVCYCLHLLWFIVCLNVTDDDVFTINTNQVILFIKPGLIIISSVFFIN